MIGVSTDSLDKQREFTARHHLNFTLLSDEDGKVCKAYGADGMLGFAKRWTFILDPELKVRWIDRDVKPAEDARRVVERLRELQKQ